MSSRGVYNPHSRLHACWLLLTVLLALPAVAEEDPVTAITREVHRVFERCRGAVVKIEAVDEHGKLAGTGFFIDPQGTIYTSYTIGGESRDIIVQHGDRKYPATRLAADSRSGVALLKVEAETPFLTLGAAEGMTVASPVVTLAYPLDLPLAPAIGMIAGFDLKHRERFFSTTHIRASVPVQRGQGGGPLLNLRGEVIGILISSIEGGAGCFVLPIEAAEKVRKDYMRFGEVRPGWIGIDVNPAAEAEGGSVAQVTRLIDDAPAERSGLKENDILLQVGSVRITSPQDVLNASFYLSAGDQVPIVVSRDGEVVKLEAEAALHPFAKTKLQAQAPGMGSPVPLLINR